MRTIKLNDGKERTIHFDYNVVADIQDRYGDIAVFPEKLKNFNEVKWITARVINEGIAKKNHDLGTNENEIAEFEVGLLMPLVLEKLKGIINEVISAFNDCMGVGKNAVAGDLTMQASSTQEPTKATE